jgi:hypothetical protein
LSSSFALIQVQRKEKRIKEQNKLGEERKITKSCKEGDERYERYVEGTFDRQNSRQKSSKYCNYHRIKITSMIMSLII